MNKLRRWVILPVLIIANAFLYVYFDLGAQIVFVPEAEYQVLNAIQRYTKPVITVEIIVFLLYLIAELLTSARSLADPFHAVGPRPSRALRRAGSLIRRNRFSEARNVLGSIPDDPVAQAWLKRLQDPKYK